MVTSSAAPSRHTPTPAPSVAAITPPVPTAKEQKLQELTNHFAELTRLIDPQSREGTQITLWLKGIGDRLLAADGTQLKHAVSYHLSDSKDPEAFVFIHEREARVVISKGLFSLIKNEDQLAAVIAHELMHVHFKERFETNSTQIQTTKVEEYIADLASCTKWLMKAGYAPRESIALFDAMKELVEKKESRLLRPWTAFSDVHGLLENRSQAVSGLIAKELKEKGAVPVDITPLSGDMKAALKAAHHISHFEDITTAPSYAHAPLLQRYQRLLHELQQITSVTSGRMPECLSEFKKVFKELPMTPAKIEEIYTTVKVNKLNAKIQILQEAYRAGVRQGGKSILPKEVREIAEEIRSFVGSDSDQEILRSGKKIAAFSRAWGNVNPEIRTAIKDSFDLKDFDDGVPPWQQHFSLARSAAARGDTSIIEAMWATGAYDARVLHFAPDDLLSSFHNVPQLTACKHAERYSIDPGGEWTPARATAIEDSSLVARKCYHEIVTAEISARRHKRNLGIASQDVTRERYATLDSVPVEVFARDVAATIHLFSDELAHPDKVKFYDPSNDIVKHLSIERARVGDHEGSLDEEHDDEEHDENPHSKESLESGTHKVSPQLASHYANVVTLTNKFEEMLAHPDAEVRRQASAGIRSFYLDPNGPCFEALIGRFPVDEISTDKHCRHPLITYVATSPALTAKERVDFLRGLEDQLSRETWNKAYFSGYELKTNREKLRHLQSVAVHQESALRTGAALISQEFEDGEISPTSVISFISEHKAFFPAVRQLGDDARQEILDAIQSIPSWDAPLDHLIDTFWALEQAKLFPAAETGVREMLRNKIISGIHDLSDPQMRKQVAETVLLSPVLDSTRISEIGLPNVLGKETSDAGSRRQEMLNQSSALLSLKDPVVRSAVTSLWADAVREIIRLEKPNTLEGRDDGSAHYISITKPHLATIASTIRQRLPVQERKDLLGALADKLELQEALAFFLRDSVTEHSRATVADAHEYFRSAEAGFEFINQDLWRREAVVQFLSQPLSPHSLERFAHRVDIVRNRELGAVTDTVGEILARREEELERVESQLKQIELITNEKRWLGTIFSKACEDRLDYLDKDGTCYCEAADLATSIEDAMPQAIPDDAREAITQSLRNDEWDLHPQRAKAFLESIREGVQPAFQAAIDKEQALFETALREGLKELQQLQPNAPQADLDASRNSLLKRLANLPEYEFVSGIEDRLTAARGQAALLSVITKSLDGLPKSFARERSREQARFDKEMDKLLRDLDRTNAKLEKLRQDRPLFLKDFHAQLQTFLSSFSTLLKREQFPQLYRVGATPLEQLHNQFDENDEHRVTRELELAGNKLIHEQEKLVEKARILQGKVERLTEMDSKIRSEMNNLKRTPTPVSAVIEESSELLQNVEMEYGEDDSPQHRNFTDEVLAEFNREYPRNRKESKIAVTPLEEQHARQFYELFWSQSAEVRSVALKLLLIPPEAEYQDRKSGKNDHFHKAFEFVAEQIFPPGMRYGSESKKILLIFLEETDPSLRGFMLAALMAASEKVAGAPEEYSAGKRLAMILSMLGPAEKKLGQAINSHPLTPEDLRSDTKSIKSMSDPLPRWDLLERVAEALPELYKDAAVPRIGSTLGAASYYIAVDCTDSVLSILRPHARELARTGLDRMEAIAIRLSNDPQLKNVAGPFIESIQQAREMIALETDHEKGVMQQRNAWKRYDGLSITVDDDTFNFHTAGWKGCGPEFRHQEKVQGEHFLDIWELDGAKDPFVRKVALAHLTAELSNILSGQPFDHDRHGSQSKIAKGNGTHAIGLFDHGCMALQPPTPEEKQQLATVLCDLIEGYLQGKSGLLERAHSIIKEHREREGVAPAYLVSVERALLALNDFMRFDAKGESSLLQRSDLGGAIAAVFRTGGVDPVFSSTIAQRFAGTGASMFLKFLSPSQLCTKIAERIEGQATGAPSITISRTQQRVMPEPIVFDLPRMSV